MQHAFAPIIDHNIAGLLQAVLWRYFGIAFQVIPWRIVALVALVLCVVVPFVLGRLQPFRGLLAEAEAMSVLYAVGVLGLSAWALWAVVGFWVRRAIRAKG